MRPLPTKHPKLVAIIAIVVGFISLATSSVQAQWPYATEVSPAWSLEMGVRIFDRPGDDLGIPVATNTVTNEVLFDSEQASNLHTAVGVDLRVNWKCRRNNTKWEFRSIIADFDNVAQLEGPNLDLPLLPRFSPDLVDYTYDSRLWSVELNHKRPVGPGLTFLIGPRFVSLDEDTTTQFEQRFDTDFGPLDIVGTATIETVNSLYGGQVGFEYNVPVAQTMWFSVIGKAGAFANPANLVRIDSNNFTTEDPVISEQSKNTGAFVGEVNARLYCEVIPSSLAVFVGYDAMVIDGVAVAPAQFLTTDPLAGLDVSNSPFFQSITFGALMEY